MPRRTTSALLRVLIGVPLLAGALAAGTPSRAQSSPQAIETPGRAVFQLCRSWLVMKTCNEYGRVEVPKRIAVGEQLFLEFGSNNKSMTFSVAAIRLADGICTLFTETPSADTDEAQIDKLTVTSCRPAT